ncbi:hypothetical protein [Bradyrhizobium sp. GM2.2]|uniref:hypothetical protein n=1 Tax=Bradyrhizobium sp. GM2.2 TaxID=3156358 RepID=UPI003397E2F9
MPQQVTRRHLLASAAVTAASAAMPVAAATESAEMAPVEWPTAPFIDRQTFFDGKIDWTFYARRREWIGIERLEETA